MTQLEKIHSSKNMQIEEKKTLGRLDMLIFLKGKICKMSSIITYTSNSFMYLKYYDTRYVQYYEKI